MATPDEPASTESLEACHWRHSTRFASNGCLSAEQGHFRQTTVPEEATAAVRAWVSRRAGVVVVGG
jgi:hypothetical protein